jgi:hypothetical protein
MLGHGTTITAWDRRNKSVDMKRAISQSPLLRGHSNSFTEANERFLCPAQSQPTFPVHSVKVQHQLSNRPDKSDHVTEFSREDSGVFKIYKVINVEPMSHHC